LEGADGMGRMPSSPGEGAEPAAEAMEWIALMTKLPRLLLKTKLKFVCAGPLAGASVCVLGRAEAGEPPVSTAPERWRLVIQASYPPRSVRARGRTSGAGNRSNSRRSRFAGLGVELFDFGNHDGSNALELDGICTR
jgi:hypothetical protein